MDYFENYYKIFCEYFEYVQEQLTNTSITIVETEEIFITLLLDDFKPMYMEKFEIIQGVEFYKQYLIKLFR